MTSDTVCPKHGTANRLLVMMSSIMGEPVFVCNECEAEIDRRLWQLALDELNRMRQET